MKKVNELSQELENGTYNLRDMVKDAKLIKKIEEQVMKTQSHSKVKPIIK